MNEETRKQIALFRYRLISPVLAEPSRVQNKYFRKQAKGWIVREEVRAMVSFAEFNLAESFEPLGQFDLIFCRNVIIYFSPALKKKVLKQFHEALHPGGVLLLGASETLYMLSDAFTSASVGSTTYYVKP